jgi:serine protease Do
LRPDRRWSASSSASARRRIKCPASRPGQRDPRGRSFSTGQGSGFFISADGYAVTNNHVVDKADSVEITTDDGKTYNAKVIGTDPRTDFALIKVDGASDFPFAKLADKPRASATGCWRSAIRSASAAP